MSGQPKRGYKAVQLWVILLTPLIVILLSTLLYYSGLFHPSGTTNHGTLMDPVVDISDLGIEKDDRHWWLLTVAPEGCDQACEEQLFWVQQIHIALGRESTRVRRKVLTEQDTVDLTDNYPGLEALTGSFEALPLDYPVQLFITDPLGNVMMKFGTDNDYDEVMDDLKTLLSRSTIG